MFEKVKALRDRFIGATDEEKAQIREEMDALKNENADAWADALVQCMKESNARAKNLNIKQQLEDVSKIISLSYIAEHYFGKSKSWLSQRINGNEVNGKPAKFTDEEIKKLNFAINDIGRQLGSFSF